MGTPPRPAAPAAAGPRRRWPRAVGRVALLALAGGAAAGVLWLASEAGLRTVLERAVAASGGRLAIAAPAGSLFGELRAARIAWTDAGTTVVIDEARIALDWSALARLRLRLATLSAARVEVRSPPAATPPSSPASLALPLGIELPDARVGEWVLGAPGDAAPLRLHALRMTLRYRSPTWTIEALSLQGDFGALSVGARIADRPPYALDARARLETRILDGPMAIDATAVGELAAFALEAQTVLRDAALSAKAGIAPFALRPLAAIEVRLTGLDLARFGDALPTTDIALQVDGTAAAATAPSAPSALPPLAGTFALRNALAGPLDAGRLPIEAARAGFAFDGERLRLDAAIVEGPAGGIALEAGARLRTDGPPTAVDLVATTDRLDLARVHSALRPSALRGTLRVAPEDDGLALDARLAEGPLVFETRARVDAQRVALDFARLRVNDGVAELAGTVAVASPHRFALAGTVARLDPSRLADTPSAELNGRATAAGVLGAAAQIDLSATLADSRLRGLPLAGRATARWRPDRVSGVEAALRWGGTTLGVRGELGATGDRLALEVDATRLQEFDSRLAGRATLGGELRDALRRPAASLTLVGRELRWADRAGARQGQARLELARPQAIDVLLARLAAVPAPASPAAPRPPSGDGPALSLALQADGLRIGATVFDTARAALSGDADAHLLQVGAVARALGLDATLQAEGRLARGAAGPRWQGRLIEASNAVAPTVRLLEPAELALGAEGSVAGPLRVEVDGAAGARLDLETASWVDRRVRVLGRLTGVPLRWLGATAAERGLRLDEPAALRLGARVDLEGRPGPGGDLRGRLEAFRESGDLILEAPAAGGGVETLAAGLQGLEARLEIADAHLSATASMRGDALGVLRAEARSPLAWTAEGALDTTAPLEGSVELAVPSLAFVRAVTGDAWRFEGALQSRLAVSGTLGAPRVSGRIEGTRLLAEQRELGMRLVDGSLVATVAGNAIDIERMHFASGAGSVTMTGALRADERSEATLVLDRMPIPLGAGQRLLLSGEARASLRGGVLMLRGALRADEGVIELTAGSAPSVSKDVVVVRDAAEAATVAGTRAARRAAAGTPAGAAEPDPEASRGFRVVSDVTIDLGEAFRVFGAGLEARLEGPLTLRGRLPEAPRLTGTVRIAQGTYTGFGQKLEIERGELVFSGPVDNPAIDIVAYRRFLPVEAGVSLTGTARQPKVTLVSKPDVPEQEKLSWLVLGTGSDTARSNNQTAALAAAGALLAGPEGSRGPGLVQSVGLDVVSVRTGQLGSTGEGGSASTSAQDSIVTLGKRLTDRLFVSYEQSVRGLQNLVRLQYEITERLSARVKAGTGNAFNLVWTWRYD